MDFRPVAQASPNPLFKYYYYYIKIITLLKFKIVLTTQPKPEMELITQLLNTQNIKVRLKG
jgi:hypothetical protein